MSHPRVEIDVLLDAGDYSATLAEDVAAGLVSAPKYLKAKYFYDEHGSELFERITTLPEYYPTRAEQEILEERAAEITGVVPPEELIELGSGSAKKTRTLIEAARDHGRLRCFLPLEFSPEMARLSAERLATAYPGLEIRVVVGDFLEHLDSIPRGRRRLVVFLGGTIGNLMRPQAVAFLRNVRRLMDRESRFLLGTDLVKDRRVLEAAYNDSAGITAEFNRNILRVVNRHLQGDFDPAAFAHVAFYNEQDHRIEMHLRSLADQTVHLKALDMEVRFEARELLWTEVSHKYTREMVEAMLRDAGLRLEHWYTDRADRFALSLSAPA